MYFLMGGITKSKSTWYHLHSVVLSDLPGTMDHSFILIATKKFTFNIMSLELQFNYKIESTNYEEAKYICGNQNN